MFSLVNLYVLQVNSNQISIIQAFSTDSPQRGQVNLQKPAIFSWISEVQRILHDLIDYPIALFAQLTKIIC